MNKDQAKGVGKDALGEAQETAGASHTEQPGRKPHLEPAEKLEQVEITPPPADSPKEGEQMQG
jgi:hypothetical protein